MIEMFGFGYKYIFRKKFKYIFYLLVCLIFSIVSAIIPILEGNIITSITIKSEIVLKENVQIFIILTLFLLLVRVIRDKIYLLLHINSGNSANVSLIKKLYGVSYLEIMNEDFAELNQKLNQDCNTIMIFFITFFRDIIVNTITIIWILILLYFVSPILLIGLVVIGFSYYFVYIIMRKKMFEISYQVKNQQSQYFSSLYKLVSKIKSIRVNSYDDLYFKKHDKIFRSLVELSIKEININNINNLFMTLIGLASQIFIFAIGSYLVFNDYVAIGVLLVVTDYYSKLIDNINSFFLIGSQYQNALSSYSRVKQYLNLKDINQGDLKIKYLNCIELLDLEFGYTLKKLFKINYLFKKNTIYWLQGKNGIGKTTLINLMLGIYGNDYSGKILINNVPIKQIDMVDFLKQHVAIVEQDPFLDIVDFYEKICMNESSKKVKKMLKDFKIQYISSDLVSSNLDNLSGGEKQKVSIILSLLSDKDVLIFDEPTASLDYYSTIIFNKYLKKYKHDKIIIVISHDTELEYDEILDISQYTPNN